LQNYLVHRKGGNIPGYTTLFSLVRASGAVLYTHPISDLCWQVPDQRLAVAVALNGDTSEYSISDTVYSYLVPAFYK
jgi:hypothetical protein